MLMFNSTLGMRGDPTFVAQKLSLHLSRLYLDEGIHV